MSGLTTARHDERIRITSSSAWPGFLKPSISDALLVALLGWLLLHTFAGGGAGLLVDSSAGLHIRYGDLQRAEGHVPVGEPFSYASPHINLVRWEWLAENLYSRIHEIFGLRGVMLLAAALIVATLGVVIRRMAAAGADALVIVVLVHLGIAVSSVHFLARPLTFTLLFFAVSLWILERKRQHLWALVPMTALWANLHGGYIGLLITLAILAGGSVLEASWRAAAKYGTLLLACAAASLANPYGWKMLWSEIEYLRADWPLRIVQEYRAPSFRSVEGLYLEIMLVAGLLAAASLARRKEFAQALLILVWAQAALTSIRHAPLFFIVAAPAIAGETQRVWMEVAGKASHRSLLGVFRDLGRDHAVQFRRNSVWPAALVIALLFSGSVLPWPRDFPASRNPVDFAERYRLRLVSTRVFTTDDWSSYLTYHEYPKFKYFLGAFVNAGHQAVTEEYLDVMNGAVGWERILARYQVITLLVPSESAIAIVARRSPDWETIEDNGSAIIAQRRAAR